MHFIFYILLGLLPSIIWLLFYLKKDSHPESNRMIIKIFVFGMLAAIPAAAIELTLEEGLIKQIESPGLLVSLFDWFIIIALTEEVAKYLIVKLTALRSSELDEPVDVILYMIIAALGFAALENIFLFLGTYPNVNNTLWLLVIIRFLSATFLHALASGVLGYYIAMSFLNIKKKKRFILKGLVIAVILHGIYNFSIITIDSPLQIIGPIVLLVVTGAFVSYKFKELKKLKSICKIGNGQNIKT